MITCASYLGPLSQVDLTSQGNDKVALTKVSGVRIWNLVLLTIGLRNNNNNINMNINDTELCTRSTPSNIIRTCICCLGR